MLLWIKAPKDWTLNDDSPRQLCTVVYDTKIEPETQFLVEYLAVFETILLTFNPYVKMYFDLQFQSKCCA